ncbi:MAG: tripartite tricarboxylate transporter substrate binding protein [Betaproteobacteria bacterium]|nr:tripartite tricarboxylate transporter substrate binding protein [Betaproteobacteria bacterium]
MKKEMLGNGFNGVCSAALVALAGTIFPASAQDKYPSRPIEFVVPWGPGGGADQLARKIAPALEKELKVSLPVINVAGATGQTGLNKMLTSPADGYSISIFIADTLALQMDPATKWKIEDIVPAAVMIRQPSAFFVAENSPLKTWKDIEAEAKKRPLKVAITGFGSADDLHVIYFTQKGLKLTSVPFPKPAERYTAILGGHADILYEQLGDVKSFLDGKQMRPILIFSEARFPAFGNVPASFELGHRIAISQFRSIAMKAGTEQGRVKEVSGALAKVAAADDYKAWLKDQYADEKSFIPAAGAVAFMKQELETMRKYAPKK